MAPPRQRYGVPQPSPWQTAPSQPTSWAPPSARSAWAQAGASWQADRGAYSDPYAHSAPIEFPAYARPDAYDPYPSSYGSYAPADYPSIYPPAAPTYSSRMAPIPMLPQSRQNFKKTPTQNRRPQQQQKPQQQQSRRKPVQNKQPAKTNNKGGKPIKTGSDINGTQQQKKEQPKPKSQSKQQEQKDPVVLSEDVPVEQFLETSKGISESRRRQIRFKLLRLFSFNGIQMKTVMEQSGTFTKRGDIHMKTFFPNFFPDFFELSTTGNDVEDVAYELAVNLMAKLNQHGILEKKVIANLASKKHGYKHDVYTRGKLCIAVMKEELEKEEFEPGFREGTRPGTAEEMGKLEDAFKRAADRISRDDLPKDERAKAAEEEEPDETSQLEESGAEVEAEEPEKEPKTEEKEEYELTDEV